MLYVKYLPSRWNLYATLFETIRFILQKPKRELGQIFRKIGLISNYALSK